MELVNKTKELILYIEENLMKGLNDKKIASFYLTSPSVANAIFKLICGLTIKDYIRKRRLAFSVKDLSKGEKVDNVACKYGYNSYEAFSRAFKKEFGLSPSTVKQSKEMEEIKIFDPFVEESFDDMSKNFLKIRFETLPKMRFSGFRQMTDTAVKDIAPAMWKNISHQPYDWAMAKIENKKQCYYILKQETNGEIVIPKLSCVAISICNNEEINQQIFDFAKKIAKLMGQNDLSIMNLEHYENGIVQVYIPYKMGF